MTLDKQLQTVTIGAVVEKRRLGQALNAKEFAVLVGISYSAAREWFRTPGFPAFRGYVFWQDFTDWRRGVVQLREGNEPTLAEGLVARRESRLSAKDVPQKGCANPPRSVKLWRDKISVSILEFRILGRRAQNFFLEIP